LRVGCYGQRKGGCESNARQQANFMASSVCVNSQDVQARKVLVWLPVAQCRKSPVVSVARQA
jgi:hypothetical protein